MHCTITTKPSVSVSIFPLSTRANTAQLIHSGRRVFAFMWMVHSRLFSDDVVFRAVALTNEVALVVCWYDCCVKFAFLETIKWTQTLQKILPCRASFENLTSLRYYSTKWWVCVFLFGSVSQAYSQDFILTQNERKNEKKTSWKSNKMWHKTILVNVEIKQTWKQQQQNWNCRRQGTRTWAASSEINRWTMSCGAKNISWLFTIVDIPK